MTITLEAIRAAGGIVHSDGNIFFRDISMLQGLAGAAPAAVAGPAWDKTRDSLATLLLGLARRPFLDFDVACIALDAATEPGMPLGYMRGAPAAPALEAPAASLHQAATMALADLERTAGKIASADALRAALAAAPQAPAAPTKPFAYVVRWAGILPDEKPIILWPNQIAAHEEGIRAAGQTIAPLYEGAAPAAPAVDASDTALLDALASESMDLRCFDMRTGQGDADVGWRVIQHHMGEPTERVVSEVYKDDPRSAIRAAIARLERDPYCTGPLHEEDAGLAAQAKEGGTQ